MASSERVVGAAENVDKRGPSEPEPYEVLNPANWSDSRSIRP